MDHGVSGQRFPDDGVLQVECGDSCAAPEVDIPMEEMPSAEENLSFASDHTGSGVQPSAEDGYANTPERKEPEKNKKTPRKRPPLLLRALLQVVSFLLCVLLVVALLATVVLADLRQVTSGGGMKKIVDTIFSAPVSVQREAESAPPTLPMQPVGYGVVQAADIDIDADFDIDIDNIPDDILSGGDGEENVNALIDWLYEELQKNVETEVEFSKEALATFIDESTVADYLSEKLAGFADDFINGTENTNITTEELMGLLEENEALLKSELNVELTPENKQNIRDKLHKVVEEGDINATIRDTVHSAVEDAVQNGLGIDMQTLQMVLQKLASNQVFFMVLGLCLLLVALLCLANYYNVAAGLTWSASAGIFVGAIVSVPLLALRFALDSVAQLLPGQQALLTQISSFTGVLAPIHYGLLIGSVVIFVGSVVWRILARVLGGK